MATETKEQKLQSQLTATKQQLNAAEGQVRALGGQVSGYQKAAANAERKAQQVDALQAALAEANGRNEALEAENGRLRAGADKAEQVIADAKALKRLLESV
jgi:predicted RNase H-like nuclease (RuvC/YqgF family)